MLVLKTGREGKLHIFFITKIFTETPPGAFSCGRMRILF